MEHPVLKTQVIIVGAGPTGLSMAAQLLRHNIDFFILEKNEKTTPLSKAIVVQARTLEILEDMGLAQKALKQGRITTGLNIFYKGKRKASVQMSKLGEGLSKFPYALSLEQSKTEKLLVDHLTEKGKVVSWKNQFTRFEQDKNGVTVYYTDHTGAAQKAEAAYLVGCDGASSLVRHQMGREFGGDTVPKLFYVADVKLKSPVINKDELFIFLLKKGFIIFFPMEGEGHYRIVGILTNAGKTREPQHFEEIETYIKEQVECPLEFTELRWFSTYKIHSRKASSFVNRRCFIAGDAAHIHTPAGGQGMNTGIQDAYNLAWKIALTLSGKVNDSVLDSYNTERVENARHLLRSTDRMFDLMAGTNGFMDFIRLNILPAIAGPITRSPLAKKKIFPLISQTGISYSHSSLTVKSSVGKIKAGVRMPYIEQLEKEMRDCLAESSFKILRFGNDNQLFRGTENLKIPVSFYSFKQVPGIFGTSENVYLVLRPDNYISYIGRDLETGIAFLKRVSG